MAQRPLDLDDGQAWQRRTWLNTFVVALCLLVIGSIQVYDFLVREGRESAESRANAVELERQYYLLKASHMETRAVEEEENVRACLAGTEALQKEVERLTRYKDEAERLKRENKRLWDAWVQKDRELDREKAKARTEWGAYQLQGGE